MSTVHLLAGLNGAGKTTYARELAAALPAVRFTLDEWMLRLHGLPHDHTDYPRLAGECRDVIWDTACQVLAIGIDVVLDWNLWSRDRRGEWRRKAEGVGARPVLHWVRVPLEVAVERSAARSDDRSHVLDRHGVTHLASIFEEPTPDEGLEVRFVDG